MGEILDVAVKAGANQISDVSFVVSKKDDILRDLRKHAIADAKAKAVNAAEDTGMVLGHPRSISVDGAGRAEQLQYAFTARSLKSVGTTTIEMGQEVVGVGVAVVYEMKPR